MPLEALILRRVFPVPVTFADLRRAHEVLVIKRYGICSHLAFLAVGVGGVDWHAAIKDATGALDEVYAVIDGREVRVATVTSGETVTTSDVCTLSEWIAMGDAIDSLLIAADEAGYWQRPHEVRVDLEESQMSHKTMARIAGNSLIVAAAGAK